MSTEISYQNLEDMIHYTMSHSNVRVTNYLIKKLCNSEIDGKYFFSIPSVTNEGLASLRNVHTSHLSPLASLRNIHTSHPSLSDIPKNKEIKKVKIVEDKECSVCLCEFDDTENISTAECGHRFHEKCIDEWIKQKGKNSCPNCRTIMKTLFVTNKN